MADEARNELTPTIQLGKGESRVRRRELSGETAGPAERLFQWMRREYRRWRLRPEGLEPGRWWNGSLRTADQIATATRRAKEARLPVSDARGENWEALEALELILGASGWEARVADIGREPFDPLMSWLDLLGQAEVITAPRVEHPANHRTPDAPVDGGRHGHVAGEVRVRTGDALDAVVCRSLPGHGVPLATRLAQGRALLRPGGLLVMASEFWDMPEPFQGGESRCASDHFCCTRSVNAFRRAAFDMGLREVAPVFIGGAVESPLPNLIGICVKPMKVAFRKE